MLKAEIKINDFGFKRRSNQEQRTAVWNEFKKCPKYFNCDEIRMKFDAPTTCGSNTVS
jgi:hypothetical protein